MNIDKTTMTERTIKEPILRELVEACSLSGAVAVGRPGGYSISVRYGMREAQRLLATARGETRVFSNLNTLANYLRGIGISRFEVDSANYKPLRIRPARPDRAEAMRRTRTKLRQVNIQFDGRNS